MGTNRMSRTVPKLDPWVTYQTMVAGALKSEESALAKNKKRYPNPRAAHQNTHQRVVTSQAGSPYDNFREESGVTRPGIDPLPHHYLRGSNWKVIRPHIADHEAVFSKPNRPRAQFDPVYEASYMSLTEICEKDPDFLSRTENPHFDSTSWCDHKRNPLTQRTGAREGPERPRSVAGSSWSQNTPLSTSRFTRRSTNSKAREYVNTLTATKDDLISQLREVTRQLNHITPSCGLGTGASGRQRKLQKATEQFWAEKNAKDRLPVLLETKSPFAAPTRPRRL